MATTPAADAAALLVSVREQQSSHPLSIVNLAEPILEAQQRRRQRQQQHGQEQPPSHISTTSSEGPDDSASLLTPSSLAVDLSHYRDLFSKLRFSYLEQVSKEKYLRSIVGDPPVLVSAAENAALEEKLAGMKQELKARKEANARLVAEMEEVARAVAQRYDEVNAGAHTLETLPREIEALQTQVDALKQQVAGKRAALGQAVVGGNEEDDPRQNMSLADTEAALKERRAQNAELDREIDRLQRQMPAKDRECKKAERELELLERQRNEATTQATEARRIRAEGGRDYVGEKGKWYAAQETVMQGLLRIEQTSSG
ncbi:hypothetical protein DV737_g453, partial [Chaetothyriales sp. CBS 132003]